jgi:polyisoprenoid-binding protein YceI
LTLEGVTKDVVATFTAKPEAGGTLIEGSVPVRRLDFRDRRRHLGRRCRRRQ